MSLSIYPSISIHRTDVSKLLLSNLTLLETYCLGKCKVPENEQSEISEMNAELYVAISQCKYDKRQKADYYFVFIDSMSRLFSFEELDEAMDCINRLREAGAQKCFDEILNECKAEGERCTV